MRLEKKWSLLLLQSVNEWFSKDILEKELEPQSPADRTRAPGRQDGVVEGKGTMAAESDSDVPQSRAVKL